MVDNLKSTDLAKKVGGKFKLTALIQKRMSELLEGSRPLIEDAENKTPLEIVIQEIVQEKIEINSDTLSKQDKMSE